MTKKLVRCPICDPWDGTVYAGWSLPRHGKQFFVEHYYCTGWVDCPLCEGSGRIDGVRWVAYQLLAANGRPTYEEIVAMVANLNSVCANDMNDYEKPLRAEIIEIACELRILLRAQHGYKEGDPRLSAAVFPPGTGQAVINVERLCGHMLDCTAAFLAKVLQEHIELFAKHYPEVAAFAERVSTQLQALRAGGTLLDNDEFCMR